MMKVNIDAGNDLVMIAKDDILMITSTPQGVWLYYKNSEEGLLITSNNIGSAELFKKVAGAIAYPSEQPTLFRKRYSSEGALVNNCFCNIQEPQVKPQPLNATPKIIRGNMSDKELASWLRSIANDIESISAREEAIPTLMKDIQNAEERLSATKLRIKEAFDQQAQDPTQHHETHDSHQQAQ